VDGALVDGELDVLVGDDAGEPLGDPVQLDDGCAAVSQLRFRRDGRGVTGRVAELRVVGDDDARSSRGPASARAK
jgi:hypothetical protein